MVDVTINTGTTVGMSATLPTTYDDNATTGYASLTFTGIGEIVDVGEIAKTWAAVTHQAVTRAYPQKLKDTYDIPDVPLTLGRVSSDTGQALLQTALASSASYAFEVTLPSGDVANFTGKVMKAGIGAIASGAVSSTTVTLAIDPETLFEA
jgi:hypothetical protein